MSTTISVIALWHENILLLEWFTTHKPEQTRDD